MGRKEIHYIITAMALIVALVGAYFGVQLPYPPMPGPDINAQAVPTQPGPPGDYVSMSYGGTYQDAIAVSVPTANATADIGLRVNNLSVAQPFSIEDAGTPVIAGYNGGGISVYAPTAVATAVPALLVNNAGVSNAFEVQDGGTAAMQVLNGGGVVVAAPTAVGTAVPGMVVNSSGVSNILEVRDASTPVAVIQSDGDLDLDYGFVPGFADETITDGETLTATKTVYALDSAGAVTMTLAASASEGQLLILIGDDANAIVINDTNLRSSTGAALTLNQYDVAIFVYQDSEWIEIALLADS